MILPNNDTHFDALMRLAFEPPPIGRPGIAVSAVRTAPPGAFPEILVDGLRFPVVGVAPTGWLSTATLGWCRFTGDFEALPQIANACNAAQRVMIGEVGKLEAAIARYSSRDDESLIGGPPVMVLNGGRRTVRLSDITVPEIRTAIEKTLEEAVPHFGAGHYDEVQRNGIPLGHIDAEVWWSWCRSWAWHRTEYLVPNLLQTHRNPINGESISTWKSAHQTTL